MAFGATMIDALGAVQDFPAASLVTGLLANALGYERTESDRLQALQDRLVHAVRLDRTGERLRDFQTVALAKDDKGWTTGGAPEGRGGDSYGGPHIRQRWYQADASALVALRLDPAETSPTLDEVAAALERPARPLFIGRKPCLPAGRLFAGFVEAPTALAALAPVDADGAPRFFWPEGEGPSAPDRQVRTGRRNWISGVHAGRETWFAGGLREATA